MAGLAVYGTLNLLSLVVDMRTFWGIFTQGAVAGLAGLAVYFFLSAITNCEEIILVKKFLQRYLQPLIFKK